MARIKNVSGEDRLVPVLGNRLVLAGQVVEVPDDLAVSFTCQEPNWAAVNESKGKQPSNNDSQEG